MEAAGFRMKRLVCTKLHGIVLQNIIGLIFKALPREYYGLTNLHLRYTKTCDYGKFEFGAFQLGLENLVTCHFELI